MSRSLDDLRREVLDLAATPATENVPRHAGSVFGELLDALERGDVRAAERLPDGRWVANA